jgi:malate synthase
LRSLDVSAGRWACRAVFAGWPVIREGWRHGRRNVAETPHAASLAERDHHEHHDERSMTMTAVSGLKVTGTLAPGYDSVLTPDALRFVASLVKTFGARRDELLAARIERQRDIDNGMLPDFLAETADVRTRSWTVAPVPADLQDRRVEITGPVDRKMIINALNSGAKVFMADFEDSNSPTWSNCVEGQINLRDAVRRTIAFDAPNGKHYELKEKTATLMVRPRGWHLDEAHVTMAGEPVPAALFDFGLFFFHNARELLARGSGPYFYLPKLESHVEARLWNDVFVFAQEQLNIPRGTIKATVLIETILAAFEMDEILWELREHSAGLNCGRWDYIFSIIKKFRNYPDFVLPDRASVGMTAHCMRSYSLLLIETCHRRGAHAMGGMAAQIPIKGDTERNDAAIEKVRADKEREAADGHDGTWVAHPALVSVAVEVFDAYMPWPNQIRRRHDDLVITAADLLAVPQGELTDDGLRRNIAVGLRYLEAWLRGSGCVPLYDLMEDAATAEISRAQLWQWRCHRNGVLPDGRNITALFLRDAIRAELGRIRTEIGDDTYRESCFRLAGELFERITLAENFIEFLTLPAYAYLTE